MKYSFLLLVLALTSCGPSLIGDLGSAGEYDESIRGYRDVVNDRTIYSVQFGSVSEEYRAFGHRYSLKMDLIKMLENGSMQYSARFVLRSNPEEWPVDDIAHIVVDGKAFPIDLVQIDPRHATRVSGNSMDGSVSTHESQIFRMESTVDAHILQGVKVESDVRVVFHSGIYPVTFALHRGYNEKLIGLREKRIS